MNALDLTRVSRLSPYKVWTEDGRDYNIETNRGQIFVIGFMDDYSIWSTGAYQFTINNSNLPIGLRHAAHNALLRMEF